MADTTRVVANRSAIHDIRRAYIAAAIRLAGRTLEVAQPNVPDAPPYGVGLVTAGNYAVFADGVKVAGRGDRPKKTHVKDGVTVFVGYPFPMRFYEEGTVHQPARPVLMPAMLEVAPSLPDALREEMPK